MTPKELSHELTKRFTFDRVKHPSPGSWYFYKKRRLGRFPLVIRISNHPPSNNGVDIDITGRYYTKKQIQDYLNTIALRLKSLRIFGV